MKQGLDEKIQKSRQEIETERDQKDKEIAQVCLYVGIKFQHYQLKNAAEKLANLDVNTIL